MARLLKNDGFVWLERNIDIDRAEDIKKKVPNIEYLLEEQRLYPERKLAASVVGFTGMDNKGLGGLEHRYENILQGRKLQLLSLKDNKGQRIVFEDTRKEKEIDTYLYLTIDKHLQGLSEEILREDTAKYMANRGIAVAMDAYTGIYFLRHPPEASIRTLTASTLEQSGKKTIPQVISMSRAQYLSLCSFRCC